MAPHRPTCRHPPGQFAMFHTSSSLYRLTQFSRQVQGTQTPLSTMPLLAQNLTDRIILGLMTFGNLFPTYPTRAPTKLPQVLMHPPERVSPNLMSLQSTSTTSNRKATMRSIQLACTLAASRRLGRATQNGRTVAS